MSNSSEEIIKQLKNLEYTAAKLAAEFKVSRTSIYQAIDGEGSRFIRVKIAKKINRKPSELWHDNNQRSLIVDDALFDLNEGIINGL